MSAMSHERRAPRKQHTRGTWERYKREDLWKNLVATKEKLKKKQKHLGVVEKDLGVLEKRMGKLEVDNKKLKAKIILKLNDVAFPWSPRVFQVEVIQKEVMVLLKAQTRSYDHLIASVYFHLFLSFLYWRI